MNTPADWLTIDYTTTGWVLRLFSVIVAIGALILALFARKRIQKRILRRVVYRTDVTIALIAVAFEIAIPVILLVLIMGLIGGAVSRSVDSHAIGCLGGGLDFFDFFDWDD
jgi:predicted MFS family arabinose efflux permease